MADTLVEGTVTTSIDERNALWGPYWVSTATACIVGLDNQNDINYFRTTDGGVNWATTQIEVGSTASIAVWFDQETPGDTGDKLHIVWLDDVGGDGANTLKYVDLDVGTDTVGTIRTAIGTLTVGSAGQMRCCITKGLIQRLHQ